MNAFYLILAASPVLLLLGAVAFFVLIAVGIRKGGCSDLATPPRNRLEAITRHAVGVGTRRDGSES